MKCLVVASFNVDLIYEVDEFPLKGQTIFAKSHKILPGGKGNNVARFLHRLHDKTDVLGALGQDVNKDIILEDLKKRNIKCDYIQIISNQFTGTATIQVNQKGQNTIVVHPGANWEIDLEKISKDFFKTYDVVFMSMENSLKIAKKIFKLCAENKIQTILNSSPSNDVDEEILHLTDFLVVNKKEYIEIANNYNIENELQLLKKFQIKKIIKTMGKKGALFLDDTGYEVTQEAIKQKVVDTTGAGDSFIAGFLSGYLKNEDIKLCMQLAAKCASLTVQLKGVQISIDSYDELKNSLQNVEFKCQLKKSQQILNNYFNVMKTKSEDFTLNFIHKIPTLFLQSYQKITEKIQKKNKQVVYQNKNVYVFFDKVSNIFFDFNQKYYKVIENFQNQIISMEDEKLKQYMQLVVNHSLLYLQKIKQKRDLFQTFAEISHDMQSKFDEQIQNNLALLNQELYSTQTSFNSYRSQYKDFIETYIQTKQGKILQVNSVKSIDNLENIIKNQFEKFKIQFDSTQALFQAQLDNIVNQESKTKKQYRALCLDYCKNLNTEMQNEVLQKEAHIESTYLKFDLPIKISINKIFYFCTLFDLKQIPLQLYSAKQFYSIKNCFQTRRLQKLIQFVTQNENKINGEQQIMYYLLGQKLFSTNTVFKQKVFEYINTVFQDIIRKNYIFFHTCIFKQIKIYNKKFQKLKFDQDSFQNFHKITQLYLAQTTFQEFKNQIYIFDYFIDFCKDIYDYQNNYLIDKIKNDVCFQEQQLWFNFCEFKLEEYTSIILKQHNRDQQKDFYNTKVKAFQKMLRLVFTLKPDIDMLMDVLIDLTVKQNIDLETFKKVFFKHEYMLISQIQQNFENKNMKKTRLMEKRQTIQQKTRKVIGLAINYIDDLQTQIKLIFLNKQYYQHKKTFYRRILLCKNHKQQIRKLLIDNITKDNKLTKNKLNHNLNDDHTIDMDVSRTKIKFQNFDYQKLKQILMNIQDQQIGDFSYYQGLNYIASYFLVLYDNDELSAYNTLIYLLRKNMSYYINSDLSNMKKLFYIIKQYIQYYIPEINDFLQKQINLDFNLILTCWCLTLFTTATQYYQNNRLLNEIIDIFISQSWKGFIKVILVLLEKLKNDFEKISYEEVFVFLNSICKDKFDNLIDLNIDMKKEIIKYKRVNNVQIAYLDYGYIVLNEQIEMYYRKLLKKIKINQKYSQNSSNLFGSSKK